MHPTEFVCVAGEMITEPADGNSDGFQSYLSRIQGCFRRGDDSCPIGCVGWIVRTRRYILRLRQDSTEIVTARIIVALQYLERLFRCARTGYRRAGGNIADRVAWNIGDCQCHYGRRMRRFGKSSAFQCREMSAHTIDFADVGAAAHQVVGRLALLLECDGAEWRDG